jgi:hypothetical protein
MSSHMSDDFDDGSALAAQHMNGRIFGTNGERHKLRAALESAGGSLTSLTVLAPQNDPFRVDTDAGHRDGEWLANTLDRLGITGQRHLRGLHYVLIGQPKPNGEPYTNTDRDWVWLVSVAKAARWLGYIPFSRIVDQRNDAPEIREWTPRRDGRKKEQRADAWVEAMGTEQTEIDALAELQPDLLRQIAHDAIAPFYDRTLDGRALPREVEMGAAGPAGRR